VTTPNDSLTVRLAAWSQALRWGDVPASQRALTRLRVLDTIGLVLRGSSTEASTIARDVAARAGGTGPGWNAFVNGVAAHCWDYDDTLPDSVVHPGSSIVPTALAVAEALGASGEATCTAIVAGYEIGARLAGYGGRRFHARGFHASGIFTPLCAAFVTAKLLDLDPKTTASAIGLAASMSGGLLAFLPDGTWSKWLHLGWGNFGGVTAAQLAQGGFRGPAGALDGRHNLYEAFLGETLVDDTAILAGLGAAWHNQIAIFKLYPCAHVIQGYIGLALALRDRLTAPVAKVECFVAPWAVPIVSEPRAEKSRPQSTMHAIASLPLHVASALLDGHVDIETIGEAKRERESVNDLMDRITSTEDAAIEGFDARIVITTTDGKGYEAAGAVAAPGADKMETKFRSLAAGVLDARQIDATIAAIADLPEAHDVRAVSAVLPSIQ
jgi:2-methylcitrate dehydratase PrpD